MPAPRQDALHRRDLGDIVVYEEDASHGRAIMDRRSGGTKQASARQSRGRASYIIEYGSTSKRIAAPPGGLRATPATAAWTRNSA